MATTDRTDATASPGAIASRLRDADFVHLLVRADGEAVAAAGILAAACARIETPYQVRAVRTRAALDGESDRTPTPESDDGGANPSGTDRLCVGVPGEAGPAERPSVAAYDAATALGADPDPALALAGVVAAGARPEAEAPAIVEASGFERRRGLATPTDDLADGLAHTTLAHAAYSGDADAATDVVERVGDGDGIEGADSRLASLLAIDAVTAEGATPRSADAIERAIHPLAGGPLESIGGYADVLDALAATAPGIGVAMAVGGATAPALDAWRRHAVAAHDGVRSVETERRRNLFVARTDGPVEAVARLLRDYRSPEPAVLALGDGEAALATIDESSEAIAIAAEAAGGSGLARGEHGYARFDPDKEADLIDAVEEAR